MRVLLILLVLTTAARADGERAGAFDYYVLSLSWSPNWCLREGASRGADQCDARHDYGWTLHGLWPQYESGWPSFCTTNHPNPSRRDTAEMTDIMGSSGLAWHQWNKHGRCSGLSADAYYALSREAFRRIVRPAVFRRLNNTVRLPASVVEEAFLKENPTLSPDMLTVTCKDNTIQEVRICLTRDLSPRECGTDVARDCTATRALFTPLR